MYFKVKEQANQEKAMEILRLAGIEIESCQRNQRLRKLKLWWITPIILNVQLVDSMKHLELSILKNCMTKKQDK